MGALAFSDLEGWADDDHAEALAVFELTRPDDVPRSTPNDQARVFLEQNFIPVQIPHPAFVTGYYEPVLTGSRVRTRRFRFPLHGIPPFASGPRPARAKLRKMPILDACAIVWLADPLDAFFAQVQGSLRVRLADTGECLRLGYAGRNGHPYRSIGAILVERGDVAACDISAEKIRSWCAANPASAQDLLDENPSYVFFRLVNLPESSGPVGSGGVPLTALRSVATDPTHIPAGSLLWLSLDDQPAWRRLCVAQDTGSAIKGPARIDLFCGTGDDAGKRAGHLMSHGRVVRLVPRGQLS